MPLTQHPSGMHAWKVLIPPERKRPQLKSHDGYEWLYVLSGELRLLLGGHDITMKAGEVAEFDTAVPHWFGAAGNQPGRDPQHPQPTRRTGPCPRRPSSHERPMTTTGQAVQGATGHETPGSNRPPRRSTAEVCRGHDVRRSQWLTGSCCSPRSCTHRADAAPSWPDLDSATSPHGAGTRALTLVSAPAGFGKTTLVADWFADDHTTAWLSLDARDNDPEQFWTYVLAALATVTSDLSAGPAPSSGVPRHRSRPSSPR